MKFRQSTEQISANSPNKLPPINRINYRQSTEQIAANSPNLENFYYLCGYKQAKYEKLQKTDY